MISILIIGNEILSAQVEDINLKHMLGRLNAASYVIDEVRIVRDDVPVIAEAIQALSHKSRFVISTGGVGPTHDDVTFKAYAMAFDQPLAMHAELEALIRSFFGDQVKESSLRMAFVPANTTLVPVPGASWPLVMVSNCFVLPGLPEAFFKKFDGVMAWLPPAPQLWFGQIYTDVDEVRFARKLEDVQLQYPTVEIGSYPTWVHPDYKARVTLKGSDQALVRTAFETLRRWFADRDALVRQEDPCTVGADSD